MRVRQGYRLPPEKERLLRKAIRLEWISIFFVLSIVLAMYLSMGASQAMKMAMLEDLLALIPPVVFLLAMRVRHLPPDEQHPYGHSRAILLAFLAAAAAILMFGLFMLTSSLGSLLRQEHPSIGHFQLFDWQYPIWGGWVMIAALLYSLTPPLILGRLKLPLARALHERTLYADANMNKADWITSAAAIIGVLGIGMGFWWADAVAAILISLDILEDGYKNLKGSLSSMMDSVPKSLGEGEAHPVPGLVTAKLLELGWVKEVGNRTREEGHVFQVDAFVVPADADAVTATDLIAAREACLDLHWKIHDVSIIPVPELSPLLRTDTATLGGN